MNPPTDRFFQHSFLRQHRVISLEEQRRPLRAGVQCFWVGGRIPCGAGRGSAIAVVAVKQACRELVVLSARTQTAWQNGQQFGRSPQRTPPQDFAMWPIRYSRTSAFACGGGGLWQSRGAIAALQQCQRRSGTGPSEDIGPPVVIFISRQVHSMRPWDENCTGRAVFRRHMDQCSRFYGRSGSGVKPRFSGG